ncbi:GNAT family N-acetyltransferase [Amycolatopsis coloradensis]|uniref:GNAT family N-acetyltransferase n=1 Tax=Amycolatopsis coloradensis TaxID=76021 RepID=UPI0013017C8E|nr:GNAT family N-acetyltransferase [Amycolatopsis coloradensis]
MRSADVHAVAAIHNSYVHDTLTCAPESARTLAQWHELVQELTTQRLPFLIAEQHGAEQLDKEQGGTVVGFAYAAPWKPGPSYRHTAEASMYFAPDHVGHGLGPVLMPHLIQGCRQAEIHRLIGSAGDWGNGSVHRLDFLYRFGFDKVGVLRRVARNRDRWIDIHLFQLDLDEQDSWDTAEPRLV